MIKAKNGAVKVRGTIGDLLVDYMCISKSVLQTLTANGFTREETIAEMKRVQEHALMTEEEILEEVRKEMVKTADTIARILKEEEENE